MTIQWFPGHMAKAKREVAEKLKLVDFVIELVDARAPESSQNPMLQQLLQTKPKMIVMMKKDLADPKLSEQWMETFKNDNVSAVAVNAQEKKDIQALINLAKQMAQEKMNKMKAKGINPRPARAMILGIPNVGKSTLINRLANKKIAKTGDRPGVTTSQQWIKVKKDFELLDTPGILWPKFEDEEVGYRLAAIGTIKDQILPIEDVAAYILDYLKNFYPDLLKERFGFSNFEDMIEAFETIGKRRGCLEAGARVNYEKTAEVIIQDLRSGKLGRITFDVPTE
ncbi:ribosome biogenesis GTPase A [Thalassobacillus devorans]|uniref:Ribosome biogenesis GTPase A n=1 Tax=Thalassobacillus devorans TaxID=279813 RepID=A0ABQ1P573_9BACI|nr:ribosome biogenesis GTPase YlqF [Thalassobacillus devorans]NIK27894.1 ribosome biogenesis GTPase A [Thalassobacillus devorans]GGC90528.1 ribosome biogenesis GTPase A [Thalassobacillus devorans]